MTLRKTLILSLGLHVLLFGAGLAFARFGGLLPGNAGRSITVALVDLGSGQSGKAEGRVAARETVRPRPKQEPVRQQQAESIVRDSVQEASAVPAFPQPAGGTLQASGQAGTTIGPGESSGQASLTGVSSGAVSSEEWAVIVSSIEKAKTYPRLARKNGIEGVVRLRFRIRPEGRVEKVEIVKSSGSEILDTASVSTVYRAGPMPAVNGWVEVPIAYVLQ